MKTAFGKRIAQFFANIKQIKIDKENRKSFLRDIEEEIIDPKSRFNYFHLSTNEDKTAITTVVSIPENFQLAGSDIMKYQKLQEVVRPINFYINNELNWGQYFLAPNFYYIDEINDSPSDDEILEEVSCSYVVEWKYEPVLKKYPNFKWELTSFIGINTLLIGGLIALLIILL